MKNFEGLDWAIMSIFFAVIVAGGIVTYDTQQTRALFQQTYNKNLECRQAVQSRQSHSTSSYLDGICGTVPVIGDFVK
jgi:hypothetical protein